MELPDLFSYPAELMSVDSMELVEHAEPVEDCDGMPLGVERRRAVVRVRVADARVIDSAR